ncbi:isocitrate lyase/phosphoenolpyruvate mutase family protein [Actinoplanes sp. NPDC049596]|uniref:isocitrate lyase/phosphoenolpyruvate mutase family protein n=1 Tax=unclassified Actinoplanes TaxID=2626549 RepID=UPI0034484F16
MSSTDLFAPGSVTHLPGVYDPASAALAVRAGIRAAYLSGEAIAATMLKPAATPNAVSATEIADRAAVLAPFLGGVPLIADAVVGFEEPDGAVWSALAYQRAGIGGLVLGEGSPARVAAVKEGAPGIAVIASAGGDSPGEAIARGRALAAAGADAVLLLGLGEDQLRSAGVALPGVRLAVNRTEGATRGRFLSDAELAEAGVVLVLHPLTAVLAALRAASLAYHALTSEPLSSTEPPSPAPPPSPGASASAASSFPEPPSSAAPSSAAPSGGASSAVAPTLEQVDMMPPAVLATLAGGAPASFLTQTDPRAVFALPPPPAPATPPFGAPAFGTVEDRPWASATEPAEHPWLAVSGPDEPTESAFDQPLPDRPAPTPTQRQAAGAAGRTWASIAREVGRLGT